MGGTVWWLGWGNINLRNWWRKKTNLQSRDLKRLKRTENKEKVTVETEKEKRFILTNGSRVIRRGRWEEEVRRGK